MKSELVTTLKRQTTRLIAELQTTKEPVFITEHGIPAAYLVDVNHFENMQRKLSLLKGLIVGEEAILEGRTK